MSRAWLVTIQTRLYGFHDLITDRPVFLVKGALGMRIGILGTGMVGKSVAARLAELDHEVLVGTRDPAATLARDEPHPVYGIPPFRVWHEQHPEVKLGSFADAAPTGSWSSTPPPARPRWRPCGSPARPTSPARS
jgi:hypothetical protein